MPDVPHIFDAHLHPAGLSDRDLDSLHQFGIRAALVAANASPMGQTHTALLEHFAQLVRVELPRLAQRGINGYAALGVHPLALPRRGLHEVLQALPAYFSGGKVVAVGAIGLHRGGEAEEEAFLEQLALAKRLQLPVLVHTPSLNKERMTRRTVSLLKESGIPPGRVCVDRAHERTIRLILECGYFAGLTVHPDELSAERAQALVVQTGSERIILDSSSGQGAGDLLGLPRLASRLTRAGLSPKLIQRLAYTNAAQFLKVEG